MKILVTADVHIRNYTSHNKHPNARLEQFTALSKLMKNYCIDNGIQHIIIAGDILDEYRPEPLVLHTLHKFLNNLTKAADVWIISGNHDAPKQAISPEHIYYSVIENPRVHYLHNQGTAIGGRRFYFKGWEPHPDFSVKEDPSVDVLITHAYVQGATLASGMEIRESGITIDAPYKLIIAGDIHKFQKNGRILIPGTPIQNSFSDSPDTGFCILETDDLSWVRVSTADRPEFVKFRYSDDSKMAERQVEYLTEVENSLKEDVPTLEDWLFEKYSIVAHGRKAKQVQNILDFKTFDAINLNEILNDLLKDFQYKEELYVVLGQNSKALESFVNQELKATLKAIKVHNFKSIESCMIDFTKIKGLSVIQGQNGAGKTTLFEAIMWGITGNSPAETEDVIQSGSSFCEVKLCIEYQGQDIVIARSRGSKFELNITIGGKPLIANNKTDLQKKLEETLPIINKLHLLYFNQSRDGLLSELNDAARVSLISELSGQSVIADLSESVDEKVSGLKEDAAEAEKKYESCQSTLEGLKSAYQEVEDPSEKITELQSKIDEIHVQIEKLSKQKQEVEENAQIDRNAKYKEKSEVERGVKREFEDRLNAIQDITPALLEEVRKLTDEIRKASEPLSTLHNIVNKKSEWTCDKCGTIIKAKDFNQEGIDNAKSKIIEIEKSVNKLKIEVNAVNKHMQENANEHTECLAQMRQKVNELSTQIDNEIIVIDRLADEKKHELSARKSTLVSQEQAIMPKMNELLMQKGQYVKSLEIKQKIEDLRITISDLKKTYETKKDKFEAFRKINNEVFGNDGLLSAAILEKLSRAINTDSSIRITTTKTLKNGKVKPTLDLAMKIGEHFEPYRRLSGGERLYADLYFLSKMIEVVSGIGFLICDETFKYFDPDYVEKSFKMLSELPSQNTFLVYHGELPESVIADPEITKIHVSKKAGNSVYKIN